jgi:polar amino acid transport system substrate-binding protein
MRVTRRRGWRRWRSLLAAVLVSALAATGILAIFFAFRGDTAPQVRPVVVLSGDWAPYTGSELADGGPVARMMTDVLEAAGFEAQLHFTTWDAVDQRVSSGSAFGGFPLVFSEARNATLLYSDSLMSFDYVLFARAGEPQPSSADELVGLRVGGIEGYDYWPELNTAANEIIRFPTTEDGLRALASGEISLLAEGVVPGRAALASPDFDVDAAALVPLASDAPWARSTQGLHFVMPRRAESEKAMKVINEAIAEVKKSDDYAALLSSFETSTTDEVSLGTPGSMVQLLGVDGSVTGFSPAGVQGSVLAWPVGLDGADAETSAAALVQLKLQSGPFAGRIVWVPLRDVEVLP